MFFYLRGKSRRGDGIHVLRAQVLRGVGKFCTVKMDHVRVVQGYTLTHTT